MPVVGDQQQPVAARQALEIEHHVAFKRCVWLQGTFGLLPERSRQQIEDRCRDPDGASRRVCDAQSRSRPSARQPHPVAVSPREPREQRVQFPPRMLVVADRDYTALATATPFRGDIACDFRLPGADGAGQPHQPDIGHREVRYQLRRDGVLTEQLGEPLVVHR